RLELLSPSVNCLLTRALGISPYILVSEFKKSSDLVALILAFIRTLKKAPSAPNLLVKLRLFPKFFPIVSTKDALSDWLVKIPSSSREASCFSKVFVDLETLKEGLTLINKVESILISKAILALWLSVSLTELDELLVKYRELGRMF